MSLVPLTQHNAAAREILTGEKVGCPKRLEWEDWEEPEVAAQRDAPAGEGRLEAALQEELASLRRELLHFREQAHTSPACLPASPCSFNQTCSLREGSHA